MPFIYSWSVVALALITLTLGMMLVFPSTFPDASVVTLFGKPSIPTITEFEEPR